MSTVRKSVGDNAASLSLTTRLAAPRPVGGRQFPGEAAFTIRASQLPRHVRVVIREACEGIDGPDRSSI